ncbi:Imm21 family immunity protein [Nocardia asteroides]|uniref:Imm21 family immunity protein n=1 Tax=Nocardia asteroides TaxID=1824 RepID=UPI001E3443D8|nr:Imm21 family immunity protein [Nocardia asteroides]UGT55935.1 immunity 21 family protein [Nocardia asteroides]
MFHTWVESAGGPLIIAPESELGHWGGVFDTDGPVEAWGDYGRACSVEGYIGLVAIGSHQALVLGDTPARTTYLPTGRAFLRWSAGGSEEELVAAALRALQEQIAWDPDEDLVWEVREPVVLFDSAWPGAEIEPDNQLHIALDPGHYRVRATHIKDPDNRMILVRLQPTAGNDSEETGS